MDKVWDLIPHEVKTITTCAGEGNRIIFTRGIYQIDASLLEFTLQWLNLSD